MKASADRHVNHSMNDERAQAERQSDPHSHAIVAEPAAGTDTSATRPGRVRDMSHRCSSRRRGRSPMCLTWAWT